MFGFHRKTQSLIPVRDLGKYEKVEVVNVGEDAAADAAASDKQPQYKQLVLVYLLCFAEALMAASVQSRFAVTTRASSPDTYTDLQLANLSGITAAAYSVGVGSSSTICGTLTDRFGRRPVILAGLVGMVLCSFGDAFVVAEMPSIVLSLVAGMVGAATVVGASTMVGDLYISSSQRTAVVARLPLILVWASVGPLLKSNGMISRAGSHLACGAVTLAIAVTATYMLDETLAQKTSQYEDEDIEKHNLLGTPRISVVDTDFNTSSDTLVSSTVAKSAPAAIPLPRLVRAPALLALLVSLSLLSFHATTFAACLPYISLSSGTPSTGDITSTTAFVARLIAGILTMIFLPRLCLRWGQLKSYQALATGFPLLYIALPLLAVLFLFTGAEHAPVETSFSFLSLTFQHLAFYMSISLAFLLLLTAVPDAFSAGSVVGLFHFARAFASAASSATASTSFSIIVSAAGCDQSTEGDVAAAQARNEDIQLAVGAIWVVAIIGAAIVGTGVAAWVREGVKVDEDLPSDVLSWETCYEIADFGDLENCDPGPEIVDI